MASTAKRTPRKGAKNKTQISIVEDVVPVTHTNSDLAARRDAAVPRGVASAAPGVYAKYAENAEVWDVEGNRYIDFVGGIGVLNTGHRHPSVIATIRTRPFRCCLTHRTSNLPSV